ncbi:MAG TPA: DUF4112 domain-containing protein [Gammaproteobacteria bacterium]|nr:DUF4112 domain-containing protein [Gammaproteobacteria bacterium]
METRNNRKDRVHRLGWWLDESIRLPGGFRIGLDGIVGLIPGIGDVIGLALSSVIVLDAGRRGVPPVTLLRMVANLLIEMVIGSIPLIGDIFDFVWKANTRNLRLLEQSVHDSASTRRRSQVWLGLLLGALIVLAAVIVWLLIQLILWAVATLGIGSV